MNREYAKASGWFGSIFAAVISWSLNQSFWWMLLHSCLGWLYIIYWGIWL